MTNLAEEIKAPADLASLGSLLGFVTACARQRGFGEARLREIELVMEEILVNVFSYAYPEGKGEVLVRCSGDAAGRLVVEVADEGLPFDPLSAAEPDIAAGVEERGIGGLGVFFVKRLVPEVRYRYEGGRNILTLPIEAAASGGA
jgi:anti-sigma regulatory factor (Ser/Thr protein kinase)